ncbi:MAG TPA: MCE family protein [Nocardioides sp.]|uniref:MCE family protein n=1 Tax=Nocardioides sp. TaxID=35761 RepID=UPI002E301794|nr:MCE family protein [Nocardioides sp.]HEX3932433.1 MCE family protein [Nocardioides sp.]
MPTTGSAPRLRALPALRLKALGIAFLCLLLAGVWLTYGVFTQKFTRFDEVTLDAPSIGLQMPERADVKIRGVIVGEVLGFSATDQGARVRLGIFPSQLHTIPGNVTGAIVPKTLFGEKYVSLVVPGDQPAATSLRPGATIPHTQVPVEVQKVLADLYPLLRTVQPADINLTLNAISTALEGRGKALGNDLATVDHYLERVNPQIPQIVRDLRLTTKVSNTYADVTPEIAQILRNTVKTTGTLEDRHQQLQALFTDVTAFSDTAHDFLRDNGDNIIRLGQVSSAQARLLARYAPEYPCLLGGLVNAGKREAQAFRGFTLHIVLETIPNQPRGYTPADNPVYGDSRAPSCLRLPDPPESQTNPLRHQPNFVDGINSPTGKGTDRVAPPYAEDFTRGTGYADGTAEAGLLKSLLAAPLGETPSEVPDLGVVLIGPMARGAKVSLR